MSAGKAVIENGWRVGKHRGVFWSGVSHAISIYPDTYMFMSLGCGEDDGQDADELEDGSQEQTITQHALQKRGLGDLRRRQVQFCRHDAGLAPLSLFTNTEYKQKQQNPS